MSGSQGAIVLDRAVSSIVVGHRHRKDFGDIEELAASIDRNGLLQPITITPEAALVCGARRLAAIKTLGWKTVSVWVRSGLSDRLGGLLAEQGDNLLHKPLTPLEAAALYRELKQILAEDAARRQSATRFSANHQYDNDGSRKFPTPLNRRGRASEQAARMIPNGLSYKTLDKITYLERIACDLASPEEFSDQARAALARIDAGAPVDPIYQRFLNQPGCPGNHQDALRQLAADRAVRNASTSVPKLPALARNGSGEAMRYPVQAFVVTFMELNDWWTHYDVNQLSTRLTDEQLDAFLTVAEGTVRFAGLLRATRHGRPAKQPGAHELARPSSEPPSSRASSAKSAPSRSASTESAR